MSLRYRLFLWVSGLFVFVSICSYFIENNVVHHELKKAQLMLRKEILDVSEKRRVDLQNFLASSIAEDAVRIDAILNNIASFSPQTLRFGPTLSNWQKGTWGEAANLLLEYKWIDFIQNTNQGKTTAALIPEQTPMESVYRIDIDEDLSWVFVADSSSYLAVRIPYSKVSHSLNQVGDEVLEQVTGVVPSAYLLFDSEAMKKSSFGDSQPIFDGKRSWPPIRVQWTEGYELDIEPFVRAFERGRDFLLAGKIQAPHFTADELREKIDGLAALQEGGLTPIPTQIFLTSGSSEQLMKQRMEDVALRYTQINIIWAMITMFDNGMFGQDLLSFPSPVGSTVFSTGNAVGVGIHTKDVLFCNKIFDDSAYFQKNASKDSRSNLATSLAVIPSPTSEHIFFGNTAQFVIKGLSEERLGYLTLGVNADSIGQRLAFALHRMAVLIHNGKAFGAFGSEGTPITQGVDFSFIEAAKENSGIVCWKNENYFYVRVQPFPEVDMYFYLLNPAEKEFALLYDLEAGSKKVVDAIRLNIHVSGLVALIIAILLLHNISRNITRPIVQLAKATGDIAEGNFDKAISSLPPQKHKDEISVLCHSFEEMVKGLQEREKVKGVLNKVVSREIAQEILKGSVHLGGEEKRVSVLFADIRGFTKMTQSMQPKEVIDLLNTCMTKISRVIDKNNGVIDKYVGDEAMALFGAPVSRGDDAFNAIKSAIEMVESINEWNRERNIKGEPSVEIGIGIHTGQVLAGNMGAENRLNYTVIGSHVNLAFRVCSIAKKMEVLITKDILNEPNIRERVEYVALPAMEFKGFDNPVEIFRILGIKK